MSGWAAVGQVAADLAGKAIDIGAANHASARAYNRSLSYLRSAPSAEVEGLRRAGLNPILAAGKGTISGVAGGNIGAPSGGMSSNSINSAVANAQQRRLIESQSAKNIADAQLSKSRQWETEYNSSLIQQNIRNAATQGNILANTAYGLSLDNRDKEYTIKALESLGGVQKYGNTAKVFTDFLRAIR